MSHGAQRLIGPLAMVLWVIIGLVSIAQGTVRVDDATPKRNGDTQPAKSWAVVVGIDAYRSVPGQYAVDDAKAVAAFLREQGFRVTQLYDQQATRQAILTAWLDKLAGEVGEKDSVLLYYAGYSLAKVRQDGRTMGYLLPVDATVEAVGATGISMHTLREISEALPAQHVLFLLDACVAGVPGIRTRALSALEAYAQRLTREPSRQLIAACGAETPGAHVEDAVHGGLFTHSVLEVLSKRTADLDKEGIVTATELFEAVSRQVLAETGPQGEVQIPQYWPLTADQGDFVFVLRKHEGPERTP